MSRSKNKKQRAQKQQPSITMKRHYYKLVGDTYFLDTKETKQVTEAFYKNFVGSSSDMKKLGGKERRYSGYNSKGERVINKIISTSPSGEQKVYTYFIF